MDGNLSRRRFLQTSVVPAALIAETVGAPAAEAAHACPQGWVRGHLSGAQALVDTLLAEGADCVFGIPGAQENELWDALKDRKLDYVLTTHEFSAACMADGYARATGRPGVLCVVPGPGLTNSLTGLGEALLDGVPIVCIVGDVANGKKFKPFQVHGLPNADLLRPVTKEVFEVSCPDDIPCLIRQAFQLARAGEPGPVAVVVPYNLLIERRAYNSPPLAPTPLPFDAAAVERAVALLSDRNWRIGIYAGVGCMDAAAALTKVAELLQAPVATSVAGKGVICERHPLSVGWGYGPQGTLTAEKIFRHDVDLVLAVGVKFGEVSTAFYSIPKHRRVIHVDINKDSLGRIVPSSICVQSEAALFFDAVLSRCEQVRRPTNVALQQKIARLKCEDGERNSVVYAQCGADPMAFLQTLRQATCDDAMFFVDVTASEHWAAEVVETRQPRTYFNPTDNQSMGWSIPAALGAQRAFFGRQVVTVTGDGCFLMSAMEISTAAREGLPVKFFVLDDHAYHYMQALQTAAYRRTTATMLAAIDYEAFAKAMGVGYSEILTTRELPDRLAEILSRPEPVLTRVLVDYRERPIRWLDAVRHRFTGELTAAQKARFLGRLGSRALDLGPPKND